MRVRFFAALALPVLLLVLVMSERPAYSHRPITTNIIFKKEIAQIFQRKCFNCHSDNNLAMSLTTYEAARPWARAIREEVLKRTMPPWGAVTGFGHFSNDVSLTQRELDIILSWADGGAPSGVLKVEESIPPVFVPSEPLWEAGPPDEILAIEKPFTVEPGSGNQTKRFELRGTFKEPRAIKGLAFKPGDRRVVRYAAIYESGTGRWLWTWTPWHASLKLPEGVVYRLPAKAAFTVEIGYRSTDAAAADASELGLYFEQAPPKQSASAMVLTPAAPLQVKPGATAQKVRAETVLASARRGIGIWPDLGEGARSFELSAVAPDGVTEPLVWVREVSADWPTAYMLRSPVALARGTRLVMTAYYDGSADKPLSAKPKVTLVTSP